MRVLLNGLTMLKPRTGVGQYTARLADAMKTLLSPDEFAVYPSPRLAKSVKRFTAQGSTAGSRSKPSMLKGVLKNLGRSALRMHFSQCCRSLGTTLYHEPNFLPLMDLVPTILTVHDLSAILHPEWHPADRARQHHRRLERAVAQAAHIITDTEQVKHEVMRELRVPFAKVTAIPLGVSPEFQPASIESMNRWRLALELPARYFLCVGTIEPRKNLLTAMKAFAALTETIRHDCPLILAGPWGWRADAEFQYFNTVGRGAGIRQLGYVPDDALPALYTGATALLYPSRYEGFGLPPLEAAACGTISVCSGETLAVREVMGDQARYCDADDVDAWRNALQSIVDGNATVKKRAMTSTWDRTAALTLQVYRQVAQPLQRAA